MGIPNYRAWDKEDKRMSYGEIEYYDDSFGVRFDHFCVGADFEVEFMQSTGLKDKNGVDIYENDIVKPDRGKPFVVENFISGQGLFESALITSGGHGFVGVHHGSSVEVIGNIYSNPELLED